MADSLATIDYTRLVLSELQLTVTALTPELRTFVETADPSCCDSIITRLQAISNTLELTGVRGARLLADEMLALLTEFSAEPDKGDEPDEKAREAHHMLLTTLEKFSAYLDYLKSGGSDRVPALVPLVNNLRACRLSPFLSESLLAADIFDLPDQVTLTGVDTLLPVLQSCRLPLMQSVLAICKQRESHIQFVESLRDFVPLLEKLEVASPVGKLQEFWLVARAVCVSVSDGSLQPGPAIRLSLIHI